MNSGTLALTYSGDYVQNMKVFLHSSAEEKVNYFFFILRGNPDSECTIVTKTFSIVLA